MEGIMFNRTMTALILAASLSLLLPSERVAAESIQGQFVLLVELEIDAAQLEPFKAAIKENGETAVVITFAATHHPFKLTVEVS
jgi:hypothetical protein